MKKTFAIIILCLCMALTLGACKKEGDMIESMISTVFTSEDNENNSSDSVNDGTVTDSDGHIGNESSETSGSAGSTISDSTEGTSSGNQDNSVM